MTFAQNRSVLALIALAAALSIWMWSGARVTPPSTAVNAVAADAETVFAQAGAMVLASSDDIPAERSAATVVADAVAEHSGALVVEVRDELGQPVTGVELRILPPAFGNGRDWRRTTDEAHMRARLARSTSRRVDETLRQAKAIGIARMTVASGGDGVARWSGLAPGDGYRFAVCAQLHVRIDPANEQQLLAVSGDAIVAGEAGDDSLSGPVSIRAGEIARHAVVTLTSGSIHGTIVTLPHGVTADVELFGVTKVRAAQGKSAVALRQEVLMQSAPSGAFEIVDVKPGAKVLRATWWAGDDVWFAAAEFQLCAGQSVNLGHVHATRGSTVEVRIGLFDVDGTALSPEQTFGPDAMAMLGINTVPSSRRVEDSVEAFFPVPIDHTMRLHGIPDGRLFLRVRKNRRWRRSAPDVTVERPDIVDTVAPCSSSIELDLVVRRQPARKLRIEFPPRAVAAPLDLVLVNSKTGYVRRDPWRPDPTGGPAFTVQLLRASDFDRIIAAGGSSGQSWYAEAPLDGDTRLVMRPGGRVEGLVQDADGNPVDGHVLRWRHGNVADAAWCFCAQTDRDGRFVMTGLPPGQWLVGDDEKASFLTPAAGGCRRIVVPVKATPRSR